MRRLSPAVLAVLGLSACVDGCDPVDLPLIGSLFGEEDVHPCLSVVPDPDTDGRSCLSEIAPVNPVPVPLVGPCLTPMSPCLSVQRVPPTKKCLSRIAPPPAPPSGPQDGVLQSDRGALLSSLAPDVARRISATPNRGR